MDIAGKVFIVTGGASGLGEGTARMLAANGGTVVVADMQASGEPIPVAIAERTYSGEFRVRIPPEQHRRLAILASEQGVSLNRLVSAKLAA